MDKQRMSRIPKTDYSKIARYYDTVRTEPGALLSKIVQYGEIKPQSKVLDVGCGTGTFPINLSSSVGCTLHGLEPSADMLKEALVKDSFRNIMWVRGDGQRLPFPNEIFDCVYMTFVLHHVERKDSALQEIHRVLKTGGGCVIMTTSHSQIRRHVLNSFPGVTAIDLKRFPSVLQIKKSMSNIFFKSVHYHVFHRYESTSTRMYLKRVKDKYASTLTLFSEEEFQRRFKIFQQRVQRKYGNQINRASGFVFVTARK
jgi:ubiquinone/menaquinone biosynthesis C-methylase UbiE